MNIIALSFLFVSIVLITYILLPIILEKTRDFNRYRSRKISTKMDSMFIQSKEKSILIFNVLAPFFLGAAGFLFFPQQLRLIAGICGVALGLILPSFYLRSLAQKRKKLFYNQLIDALLMLNSSLKGGLSFVQGMEVVADEMPPPISQEFSILIGENKMGVALEASLQRLYDRMSSPALQQFISAVLLARETGGNLPVIFNRIIGVIRENRKIQQNIETLTIQGKIQGFVMSALPVLFGLFVFSSNRSYFDVMINSDVGRNMLILAAFLQVIGIFLIIKISQIGDF